MLRLLILLAFVAATAQGCKKAEAPGATPDPAPAPPANPAVPNPAGDQAAAPAANPGHQSALDKLTTTIVDRKQALAANPNLVEIEKNALNATDPITYAGNAYFSATSQIYVAALKHEVDLQKAMNDKLPTFAEFEKMLQTNHVQLKGLYRWQVYAYDDSTGAITILEDPQKKKEIREAAGLPADE
jgi:hypothetical protein